MYGLGQEFDGVFQPVKFYHMKKVEKNEAHLLVYYTVAAAAAAAAAAAFEYAAGR